MLMKNLVRTYSRGNDFATIKKFDKKTLFINVFGAKLDFEEMIFNPKEISIKIFFMIMFGRKLFKNKKNFFEQLFKENF